MTGKALTIAGGKGGVGKTTTTINLSIALQRAGHDVVVVDADLGMTNLGQRMGVEDPPYLHDVLANDAALTDAISEGPAGVSVLAGDDDLAAVAKAEPAALAPVIEHLREEHDVVLVDTGAGLSHQTIVAAGATDGLLLVTTPDNLAAEDTHKTGQLADRVDSEMLGAVVTRADIGTDTESLSETMATEVLEAVPENEDVISGDPALVTHPDSYVAGAYEDLSETVADRLDIEASASEASAPHGFVF